MTLLHQLNQYEKNLRSRQLSITNCFSRQKCLLIKIKNNLIPSQLENAHTYIRYFWHTETQAFLKTSWSNDNLKNKFRV